MQSKEQNLIWNLILSLAAVAAAGHLTSFNVFIYKIWVITYLTDMCEKLFGGPCLNTGFIIIFNVNPFFSNRYL